MATLVEYWSFFICMLRSLEDELWILVKQKPLLEECMKLLIMSGSMLYINNKSIDQRSSDIPFSISNISRPACLLKA